MPICHHKRIRAQCIDCKGSAICDHNRQRAKCKDCKIGKTIKLASYVNPLVTAKPVRSHPSPTNSHSSTGSDTRCTHGKVRVVCIHCLCNSV
ncbi:hypothetical protein HDV03_003045 [Kappamyces sp. JEL0829]|nr:hypothetical protein HDV03_003045 [Kappamyces sp. JEL0829]